MVLIYVFWKSLSVSFFVCVLFWESISCGLGKRDYALTTRHPFISQEVGTNFANKRRSLGIVRSRTQATNFIFVCSCFGVKLSLTATSATVWPILPAPHDGWWWVWSNEWQGKQKCSEKTCRSAALSTTNPMWLDPGSNMSRRGGKPATNCLNYGAPLLRP
jgi:hypothetical protein